MQTGEIKTVGKWKIRRNSYGAVWAHHETDGNRYTAPQTDAVKVRGMKSLPERVKDAMIEAIAERYGL